MLSETMQQKLLEILNEDIAGGDVTTALVPRKRCKATITAREHAIVAGLEEAGYLFEQAKVKVKLHISDGDNVEPSQIVLELEGTNQNILAIERSALNIIGRMSGVATKCAEAVQAAKNPNVKLLLTRKTMPGLNAFDKKACAFGGVGPHRMNLSDMMLIKENHLAFFETVPAAILRAKKSKYTGPVEVEVQNGEEALLAARTGAVDILMLDNFPVEHARKTLEVVRKICDAKIELSGGITIDDLPAYAALEPNFISLGYLTKDARSLDFSLDIGEILGGEA